MITGIIIGKETQLPQIANLSNHRVRKIRLGSVEIVLKGVNQCGKKWPGLQTAGLSDGQDPFHPAVALFTCGTLGSLSPMHAEELPQIRCFILAVYQRSNRKHRSNP